MPIYTKKGDKGRTCLYSGERVSKDSLTIEAIGAIDEANSWLGIIGDFEDIQRNLMTISSILAGADLKFALAGTRKLEKEIDKLDKDLPILTNFILPGGSKEASLLHLARSVVRRAERAVVVLAKAEKINPNIPSFLNRLSDFLFTLARKANYNSKIKEVVWFE